MILSTILIIFAYLMGSICSAVIVSKTFSLPDPRTEGSNNPGATNVLRLAGKKFALLVLITDILKGTIPVLVAKIFSDDPMLLGFVALAAVIGHMYPVFFNFEGGKGVATAIGALLGFQFIMGTMVIATWLLIARFTRYSSLASIISICLAPFYGLIMIGHIEIFPPLFLMALLIIIKHKNNISRLLDGVEPKIQLKKTNVFEEVMDDESAEISDVIEKKAAMAANESIPADVITTSKKPRTPKVPKAAKGEKPAAAKAKPAVKKTTTKTETETTKKTSKQPAAPKKKVEQSKEN
ncbi:MAG: glycerol-3-phosphate 1-O-acyltransferase PlsY [Legionella sp.]|uniref:glycerol-3-phosphate 1-O-acyltransferase PlsY n=1 Tax=Legionella sp. TaxID=459 RepID=UPI0039E2EFD7